ncbi:Ig-like domain-containing protein, partial [Kitasatospora sp. NPDC053057]|uniref:Ig-like domain-containing protein n=1 Tax=Kitasatospora sp. NPDC053057 TaxID=3364062 RepID=UPI0037C542C0
TGSMTFPTAGPVSLTATVTAAGTTCTCTNVVSIPVAITVTTPPTCLVLLLPPMTPVVAGQPTVVSAVVLCNGVPVPGATVTFNGGGAIPVTVTTNALGIATGSMTFPTAGPVSLTATVTAAGTTCTCTNVVSLPVPITVTVGGPATSLQALPSCWQGHWEHALPDPSHGRPYSFTATLEAQLTPAAAGVTVNFLVAGQPVGSAVTDASGIATLTTDLDLLQVRSGAFTATATVGGTTLQSTGTLLPCQPL